MNTRDVTTFEQYLVEFFSSPDVKSKIGGQAVYNTLLEFVSEWARDESCEVNVTPQIITNFFVDWVKRAYKTLLEFVSEWARDESCEVNVTPQIITNFFVDLVDSLFVFDDRTRKMLGYCICFYNGDFPIIYEDKNCLEQRALGNFFIRYILYQILLGFEEEYFSVIKVTYRFLTLSENPLDYGS